MRGEVERLKTENEALKRRCTELETELASVKAAQKPLTPEKRDRILAALGVGQQSPQYKRVKAELDKLMP